MSTVGEIRKQRFVILSSVLLGAAAAKRISSELLVSEANPAINCPPNAAKYFIPCPLSFLYELCASWVLEWQSSITSFICVPPFLLASSMPICNPLKKALPFAEI